VALSSVAFIAIGILGYYFYGYSVLPGEREGAQVVSGTPADINAGDPPTPSSPVGVTAASGPSAPVGTGSVAAIGGAIPAPSVEPSNAITSSPVGQGTAAATGAIGVAGQTPSPTEPRRQVSTSDDVPATNNEVTAKHSAPNRPMRTYPAATAPESLQLPPREPRANVRPDASRSRPCTEGVAALGLCSLKSGEENK
jgi:hypothetical protein